MSQNPTVIAGSQPYNASDPLAGAGTLLSQPQTSTIDRGNQHPTPETHKAMVEPHSFPPRPNLYPQEFDGKQYNRDLVEWILGDESNEPLLPRWMPPPDSTSGTSPSTVSRRANGRRVLGGVAQAPAPIPLPPSSASDVSIAHLVPKVTAYRLFGILVPVLFAVAKYEADTSGHTRLAQTIELVGVFIIAGWGIAGFWKTTPGH